MEVFPMRYFKMIFLCLFCLSLLASSFAKVPANVQEKKLKASPSKLFVLWTSGDREVALKMVFMYTYNAKKNEWWDTIRFIVWGPSSKLLSEDAELQEYLQKMKKVGVEVIACKACADLYGVSDKLAKLGLEVKYVGGDVTAMLKDNWASLTF
jgi:hypothetical protein